MSVILRKRLGRTVTLNKSKKTVRLAQFTLRRVFSVVAFVAIAIALAPKLWNARLTAPGRIDVRNPGTLALVGTTIHFPVKPETIDSFYVWDGGTYGVKFVDDAGVQHVVASWQPLGEAEHHGEILIGGMTPSDGGKNVGKIQVAERLIFSLMEIEDQTSHGEPKVIEMVYPSCGRVMIMILRRLAEETGIL